MLRIKKKEEKLSTEKLMEYHNSKSILAKIIAGEDLELVHDSNAKTAYIDLEARRVCIPMWNNMTPSVYDLFLAHEVSHALHTPTEGYHGKGDFPAGFRTFLNVTEDSRIERLIVQKYPGLRALFSRAYGTLHDEDFFGLENKPVQGRLFIDRLNLHTKLNSMNQQIFIEFNETEQDFIDRLQTCNTFEQILAITQEIYDYCKEEQEEKRQEEEEEMGYDGQDEDDDSNTQSEYENEYDFEEEGEEGEESSEEDYEEEVESSFQEQEEDDDSEEEDDEEVYSETSASEQESMEQFTNTDADFNIYNVNYDQDLFKEGMGIRYLKLKDYFKDAYTIMEKGLLALNSFGKETDWTWAPEQYNASPEEAAIISGRDLRYYNKFLKENNSIINTMVQGFMRKKSASNYYRNTESKTGVLNMSKLHGYKYNEDLFKKVINNFDGDNYGMVFLLDQSGSMLGDTYIEVLEQLLILVEFCRRVQMPYKVLSFTNSDTPNVEARDTINQKLSEKIGQAVIYSNRDSVIINEFLNSTDKQSDHKKLVNLMLTGLLSTAGNYSRKCRDFIGDVRPDLSTDNYLSRWHGDWLKEYTNSKECNHELVRDYWRYKDFTTMFVFNGTPLNASLLMTRGILMDFKRATNVEKVTFVALTDGGNTSPLAVDKILPAREGNLTQDKFRIESVDPGWYNTKKVFINLKIDDKTYKIGTKRINGYDQSELLAPFFDLPWLNTVRIHLVARAVTSGTFYKAFLRDNNLNRELTQNEKKMRCVIKVNDDSSSELFDKEVFLYGIKDNELGVDLDTTKKITKSSLGKVLNSLNLQSSRKKMLANSYIDTITL